MIDFYRTDALCTQAATALDTNHTTVTPLGERRENRTCSGAMAFANIRTVDDHRRHGIIHLCSIQDRMPIFSAVWCVSPIGVDHQQWRIFSQKCQKRAHHHAPSTSVLCWSFDPIFGESSVNTMISMISNCHRNAMKGSCRAADTIFLSR